MAVVRFRRPRGAVDVVQHAGDDVHRHPALGHAGGSGASQIVPSEMKPQASRQLAGHLPCAVVHGSGPEEIAEHPRGPIRHAGTLLAEERNDGCGQGHAVRVPVLGCAARNRPHARVKRHVGPSHPDHFAAALAGQESGLEDAAHGGGEVVKRRPQGANLSAIQHALPCPFGARLLDEGRGVGCDPLMRHREIQHASYERQHAIRHNRRVVGDGGDQRVHVASGHVGDESVPLVRKEFAGDDPLVFRPALLVGLGVVREVLNGHVCDRRPVAGVEAVCRRVRAVQRDLGEDLPRLRARLLERDGGVVAEGHPA